MFSASRSQPPDAAAPKVSGSLASHYAPATTLRLVQRAQLEAALDRALADGQRVALWSRSPPRRQDPLVDWYPQPESAAVMEHELYRMLRILDAAGAELILIQAPPARPAWAAVNDRLKRAAAPR